MLIHKRGLSFVGRHAFSGSVSQKTIFVALALLCCGLGAQGQDSKAANNDLLEKYVLAKGAEIIVFDSTNIKQFWTSNTVAAKDGDIRIALNNSKTMPFTSVPLKIQLANVKMDQDCKVEVITSASDAAFTVKNTKNATLSSSAMESEFIQYNILSSTFHLTDTQNLTFNLNFSSPEENILLVKKIILSFPKNKDFSFAPGVSRISEKDITYGSATVTPNETAFTVTGKNATLLTKKNLLVGDVFLSAKIRNLGDKELAVTLGYVPYSADGKEVHAVNMPCKGVNNILKVVECEANSSKLIVDSYPEWEKNCRVAINAKEDLSDIPNFSLLDGMVVEINKLEDGQAEIVLDKPIVNPLKKGTPIRINSASSGAYYMYSVSQKIQPGEEAQLKTETKVDNDTLVFSSKVFFRGVYYVKPLIMLSSGSELSVQFDEYTVSH